MCRTSTGHILCLFCVSSFRAFQKPSSYFFPFIFLKKSEPSMWFFLVIFLVPFPCNAKDECSLAVSTSHTNVDVTVGQRLNLTCKFTCLSVNYGVQLLKDKELLSEQSLSKDWPESKHNFILFMLIPAVQHNDSGMYTCQTVPGEVVISVMVNVGDKPSEQPNVTVDKHTVKPNVTDVIQLETSSEVKSTCNASFSWNAPLWYLLGKTVLFLICSLSVVLKKTC
ncbi:uncharacterized protein LOC132864794 [Neoarius graeffei]|uniref:uncharacterized protein LOC132864794 n=1 Tax=Neoarius graeffei TaxID=443677 RepID=UPI00298D264B|nr:uncharacterized protein LOC132864794 [Neoarius graeffei]